MVARAAEALEHQARYTKMFEDPRYQAYNKVALKLITGLSEAAEVEMRIARIGMMASQIGARAGEPYWWDSRICTLVESVYRDMPPWVMTRPALPTPAGFFWFDKPIDCGNGRAVKAIFWGLMTLHPEYDPGNDQPAPLLAIKTVSSRPEDMATARGVVASTLDSPGEEAMDLVDAYPGDGKLHVADPRWERPRSTIVWTFDRGHDDIVGNDLNPLATVENGFRDKVGTFHGTPARDDATAEAKILAACFAFLQQRFLTTHKQKLTGRTELRRLAREGIHNPEVRVIALRKAFARVSGADRQSGDPVDWSCRWIVGGHWRNQACGPGLTERRPKFILPHLKGPEDKELRRVPNSVFSVHR